MLDLPRPLRALEPFAHGSPEQRLARLRTRLFAEVGLVTGTLHAGMSLIRNRHATIANKRDALWLRHTPQERERIAVLRRDLMIPYRIPNPKLVDAILAYGQQFRTRFADFTIQDVEDARQGDHNTFFHNLYEGRHGDPFRSLAVSRDLARLVTGYFSEVPVLTDIELNFSPPDQRGKPYSGSQRWHRDIDQASKLKLFVLLHDVGPDHGPTQVLPRAQSGISKYFNFPGTFGDDQATRAGIDLGQRHVLTGRAGDAFLVDTSKLIHCGSRDVRAARFLLILSFGPVRSRLTASNEARTLRAPHLQAENEQLRRALVDPPGSSARSRP